MYYVGFSSCTIVASLILFQGFNTTDAANTFSLLTGFIVTFLGVHLLNLSRIPESPLDHPNGHSTLEGGLMNPRLSLQGRMSLDGWNGPGVDGGIDTDMVGSLPRGSRHGRQNSLYRSQTTTLFNAFEGSDGEVSLGPVSPHRRQQSTELHQLRKADEWEHNNDDDDENDNERTALRKGRVLSGGHPLVGSSSRHNVNHLPSPRSGVGSSRSSSRSPVPHDSSLTDVRITPRS
jgi:hypothetical protein